MHRADLEALAPILEKLRRAVREHRRVSVHYRGSRSPHPEPREVDPYALVHRWGWWYAIGYCHLRRELRSFRVDRMEGLNLTAQVFQVPDEFDIQAYLADDLKAQPLIAVRMRFAPQAAHVAHDNRVYWESIEEQPDGSVLVTMHTPDLLWAASTALAYGPVVKVLEPPALQRLVAEWAQAIHEQYRTPNEHDSNADQIDS